jgi:hypothetical protein
MRRIIMALVAGGVLAGAVYGAAASLGSVTGQNIAASDATVTSCDSDGFDVGYNTALDTSSYPAVQRASQLLIESGFNATCEGKSMRVRLTTDPDQSGPLPATVIRDVNFIVPPGSGYPYSVALGNPAEPMGPLVSSIDDIHFTQES